MGEVEPGPAGPLEPPEPPGAPASRRPGGIRVLKVRRAGGRAGQVAPVSRGFLPSQGPRLSAGAGLACCQSVSHSASPAGFVARPPPRPRRPALGRPPAAPTPAAPLAVPTSPAGRPASLGRPQPRRPTHTHTRAGLRVRRRDPRTPEDSSRARPAGARGDPIGPLGLHPARSPPALRPPAPPAAPRRRPARQRHPGPAPPRPAPPAAGRIPGGAQARGIAGRVRAGGGAGPFPGHSCRRGASAVRRRASASSPAPGTLAGVGVQGGYATGSERAFGGQE